MPLGYTGRGSEVHHTEASGFELLRQNFFLYFFPGRRKDVRRAQDRKVLNLFSLVGNYFIGLFRGDVRRWRFSYRLNWDIRKVFFYFP